LGAHPYDLPVADAVEPDAYLPGTWSVERQVHDAALGSGTFDGTATFAPGDAALMWQERGRLRLGGYDGPASRTLRVVAEDGGWVVRFEDGRLFHPLELLPGGSRVIHPCGEDAYAGEYTVLGADAFDVRWRVTGPAKDQRIESRYRRRVRPR
jgi:Family of unknown function (DUF6314)